MKLRLVLYSLILLYLSDIIMCSVSSFVHMFDTLLNCFAIANGCVVLVFYLNIILVDYRKLAFLFSLA